jgi:hypothetical protein
MIALIVAFILGGASAAAESCPLPKLTIPRGEVPRDISPAPDPKP